MNEKTAAKDTLILAVSFGTSYRKTREATIGAIEETLREAFPQHEIRRAFTSGRIIQKLKERDGLHIDTVKEALDRAAADGFRRVVVQPTHMIDGLEYRNVQKQLRAYEDAFDQIALGAPLLDSDRDFAQVIRAVTDATKTYAGGRTAVVLMGHGTEAAANGVYARLQEMLREEGFDRYFIGTVEAKPDLADVMAQLRAKGGLGKVVLQPLMVVAGDHAINDMAGDSADSWKSILAGAGYEVSCILKGLGEFAAIRQIYAAHAEAALKTYTG